ncbi:hypothetical protein PUNSTDRAFT_51401 [Punctularia strigosozonata HHB-11173 SS5]|uniref:uncharacterized protein n=1 Tax=Punctularia strigosozonata (strain HHB-11173) TaxID=741275 RepID=UPI0004416D36|nr:uncharacterized protein PUNSTDRAFT_51401 [Punctularia strigosozonata HHB-11173 SS5]EIN10826.1 hypothetical protein PUNSTDRAFT_51401 [Punctularia strigosozonata HHB-11173 SS5]
MPAVDLAEEERLDELDPLRHLRDDDELVPSQPHSVQNERLTLSFPTADNGPVQIELLADAKPGCGGIAWPAGEVLSRYISRCGLGEAKEILELGSGTGLVGLVAGSLGGRVWITDQAPLLDIMRSNVALNGLSSSVSVAELNWGESIPPEIPRSLDLLLLADCVYFEPAFPLLVQTLCDLTSPGDPKPKILFCYKKRRKADKRFFTLLKKHFDWEEVEGDPDKQTYNREAITLLRLRRRG